MNLNGEKLEGRIIARQLARELQPTELDLVAGAGCTKSTCSASGWDSCDLDQCGDFTQYLPHGS